MNHLEGKVAIITGSGGGFGKLTAKSLAELGCKVMICDIKPAAAASVAREFTRLGYTAESYKMDVCDKASVDECVGKILEKHGKVDILVNNAGIMPLSFFADKGTALPAWEKCVDITIKGMLYCVSAVYDSMMRHGGQIVNVATTYANGPAPGSGVYSASKAALIRMSDVLGMETRGKIRVSTVRPSGCPATGLFSTIQNQMAGMSYVCDDIPKVMEQGIQNPLKASNPDRDDPEMLYVEPQSVADSIVYILNQPAGILISDLTVRAAGEVSRF